MNAHNRYGSMVREIAGPRLAGDPVKQAVDRAAKFIGLPYWRVYDLWYERNRSIELFEETLILDALSRRRKLVAKNEIQELKTRLAALEAKLLSDDEEFHSPDISAIRQGLRMAR